MKADRRHRLARLACALGLLAALAGCTRIEESLTPAAPGVRDQWAALLKDIREFERSIGFKDTGNFAQVSPAGTPNAMCGYAPYFHLPYSYEDPAVLWRDVVSQEECLEFADGGDVSFGTVEALGEVNAPIIPAIIDSTVDRFLYLVIHEDCHDQFELPYGVEEAVCELITYKAMPAFSEKQFGWTARAHWAVRRYAQQESRRVHATIAIYGQLETLYARLRRKELTNDAVMLERARIFADAERTLGREAGTMNNVAIGTDMTYSRHYPALERVFDALGRDLARTVAFLRHVDATKPSREAVLKELKIDDEKSVEAIRAYETAVMETMEKALAEYRAR